MTMKELSALLGVSTATISNALTGAGRISESKRQEILTFATEHGYDVQKIAEKKKSMPCSIIIEDNNFFFTQEIARGVCAEAEKNSIFPEIYNLRVPEKTNAVYPDMKIIHESLNLVLRQIMPRTRGLIYISNYCKDLTSLGLDLLPIPVVCSYGTTTTGLACLNYDDGQGAYLATNHLIQTGCRRIAMISGRMNSIAMTKRLQGYQRALLNGKLEFDPSLITVGEWSMDNGYESMNKLLQLDSRPDAVFCQSDLIAVGALHAAFHAGLSVPDQLSIVGFDDMEVGRYQLLPITTIHPPCFELGQEAFRLLQNLLSSSRAQHANIKLPCRLITRQTTKSLISTE